MKTNSYLLFLLGLLAAGATACGDAEIMTYDAAYDAVRFTGISSADTLRMTFSTADSCSFLSYSFIDDPFAQSGECEIPIFVIGKPADTERPVNYRVVAENTTAPDGTYEILSASIPAGQSIIM